MLAELGQGGMGVVYQCLDERDGIKIAMKALPPELLHDSHEVEEVKENFKLVSRLVHQHIAVYKYLEHDTTTGDYYLVMECVEGEDLRRWIKRKHREEALTLNAILPVVKQIAEALDYAHAKGIIHRDIKPGNVMIDIEGDVKVLDFGLAAQIQTSMIRVSMGNHGTSGTGPYMAPEQWRGHRQKAATDQYALAVMIYEMLAGHLPFESTDISILKDAVLKEEAEQIEDISDVAWEAICRAMSKDASNRFKSCMNFVSALKGDVTPRPSVHVQTTPSHQPVAKSMDTYVVIDLSEGVHATSHPVSFLSDMPRGGWSDVYKTDKFVLRRIEAGTFMMGSPGDELGRGLIWFLQNEDLHQVILTKSYYMGVFQVTQKQWELVMGNNPSRCTGNARPVECVSYNDIRGSSRGANWPAHIEVDLTSFMGKLRARTHIDFDLPTEAQWEYACRAGTTTALNSGQNLTGEETCPNMNKVGRYDYNQSDGKGDYSSGHTTVGSYLPNAWGLYDMHGNVWEWCLDRYGSLGSDAVTDPVGVASGVNRCLRGGKWGNDAQYCRSAYRRYNFYPSFPGSGMGLRLAFPVGLRPPEGGMTSDKL